MTKAICILLFLLPVSLLHAQSDFFVLKKGQRTIRRFHEKDPIIFQHKNGDWFTGDITSIANDSFVFRQEIIYYYLIETLKVKKQVISLEIESMVNIKMKMR